MPGGKLSPDTMCIRHRMPAQAPHQFRISHRHQTLHTNGDHQLGYHTKIDKHTTLRYLRGPGVYGTSGTPSDSYDKRLLLMKLLEKHELQSTCYVVTVRTRV
jgi:hypothetical protein